MTCEKDVSETVAIEVDKGVRIWLGDQVTLVWVLAVGVLGRCEDKLGEEVFLGVLIRVAPVTDGDLDSIVFRLVQQVHPTRKKPKIE